MMAPLFFPLSPMVGRSEAVHDLSREDVSKVKSSAGTGVYTHIHEHSWSQTSEQHVSLDHGFAVRSRTVSQGVSSPRRDCCINSRMRWEGKSWLNRKWSLVSAASAVMSKPEITPARDRALPVA